jgi:hypothetical protein
VALPTPVDDVALAEQASRADVIVTAGRHWFPAEPPAPFLRLSYAGAEPTMFAQGVHRLANLACPAVMHGVSGSQCTPWSLNDSLAAATICPPRGDDVIGCVQSSVTP